MPQSINVTPEEREAIDRVSILCSYFQLEYIFVAEYLCCLMVLICTQLWGCSSFRVGLSITPGLCVPDLSSGISWAYWSLESSGETGMHCLLVVASFEIFGCLAVGRYGF